MNNELPSPILDRIPEKDRVLLCGKCMIEQPIRLGESNGTICPIFCSKCGTQISQLRHAPPYGWVMDFSWYERKGLEALR